jgi:DNA-directed RNA polymerase specialized sigma24 family protein
MRSERGRSAESKPHWILTSDAFERLLSTLAPERDSAAVKYEHLRQRTIGLLSWWGASKPEELADETFDRVARKLAEGAPIPPESLGAFVRGVARRVFYESGRERFAPLTGREEASPLQSSDLEAASECLDTCLGSLAAADRTLLIRYYGAGPTADLRRRMADELQISMTALRIRTHRLRASLERCLTACLGRKNKL